jgi:hypothetical protein
MLKAVTLAQEQTPAPKKGDSEFLRKVGGGRANGPAGQVLK